jgi:hypothetical protein
MATVKKKSEARRKYHCACATGDLSAIEPVTVSPADGKPAKPVESESATPAAAATPGSVGQQKTSG